MASGAILAATLCLCNFFRCQANTTPQTQEGAQVASHYYWNEVTGDTQYQDPGDVPLHDEEGNCFWLDSNGNRLDQDPNAGKYAWIETWSEEHSRPFYYDQVSKISTWDKPADLAWRRVYLDSEANGESASGLDAQAEAKST